ncbi:HsdM family class I SAM-dependent methyltransferase [Nostoc sp. LEGE 12450]|uniref:HsdM family class I SAM-dependent methyltransferase n=1 Tax=Nostoc sp. LEGE 12450 TaxID=1828643 RepID=UPI002AD20CFB|nr:N-6 DNA methylase [Nostoc sp. LEGE 12450]
MKLLEKYNLSDTSEDIKGIAFERFLGRTFRDEIGQFFTPRSIVEFMIRMVEPKEGDVICDPASGSGGFLIRVFEIVRQAILADADREYEQFKSELAERNDLNDVEKARLRLEKYDEIQKTIDQKKVGSRLWKLANRCIYGTDANDRMARTSKMNMIMHGDGHGGVHHHDGFININGIFEERFDIVLTNPPFGANVEESDVIEEASVIVPEKVEEQYTKDFGNLYTEAMKRVRANVGKSITSLFELPKNASSKTKTEILFIERCLSLLKAGGRLAVVLPEGIFNNPSLAYVREFCEDRAFIRAVVSLPQETFLSSGASVKASLLFMQKFTEAEQKDFDAKKTVAKTEIDEKYAEEIAAETNRLNELIATAKKEKNTQLRQTLQKELKAYLKQMETIKQAEARALLKERFPYPIFLYDADKVGITATGEEDQNELYPNNNQPSNCNVTCLDMYHDFRNNPERFMLNLEESAT